MVISTPVYLAIVAGYAIERCLELVQSRRNLAHAMSRGAIERGHGHYPAMVTVHIAFLVSAAGEVLIFDRPFPGLLGWTALALAAASQALRLWVIRTLGDRWNTRIVVIPGKPLVTSGPYRIIRHPNYLAVAVEIAALPMIHGCWMTAIVFSIANAVLMLMRIPAENRALAESAPVAGGGWEADARSAWSGRAHPASNRGGAVSARTGSRCR